MYFSLNYQSGEAIYRQIVEQVKYKVATGELKEMNLLPSIREMAKQLKINPRTVVRAYEELRSIGLVVMRQGQGVFITSHDSAPVRMRQKAISEMARRLLAEASRMGAGQEEVLVIFKEAMEKMRTDK